VVPDFPSSLYNTTESVKGELVRRIDVIKQEALERLEKIKKQPNL